MTTTIELSDLSSRHIGKTITVSEGGTTITGVLRAVGHTADGERNGRLLAPLTMIRVRGVEKLTYPSTKTIELHDEASKGVAA